jgi:hypothetical protein
MGENYDKWSVCDWKVRCWEQETTRYSLLGVSGWWSLRVEYLSARSRAGRRHHSHEKEPQWITKLCPMRTT